MQQTVEISLPELLERVQAGQIPSSARVRVTFDDAPTADAPQDPKDPTLALFEQWAREDAEATPEERAEEERIYAQIERNGIPRVQI